MLNPFPPMFILKLLVLSLKNGCKLTKISQTAQTYHPPNLMEFVLRSTYFMYSRNFYEQLEGVAIGSPVSAIIANLLMDNFEQKALRSCPPEYVPQIGNRYVDDTFIATTSSTVNNLLLQMNSATNYPLHHGSGKQQPDLVS